MEIKSPGLNDDLELATLSHDYPQERAIDGYEKLLRDAINGNQSSFVHADEVMESWRIVDDLLCTGDSCPIRTCSLHLSCWYVGTNTQNRKNN